MTIVRTKKCPYCNKPIRRGLNDIKFKKHIKICKKRSKNGTNRNKKSFRKE